MTLSILGINHQQSVRFREALAFGAEEIPQAVHQLTSDGEISGAVILSTCNRVEIYFTATSPLAHKRVLDLLTVHSGLSVTELAETLYHHEQEAAIRHALQVCCGVDSIVLGEPQIMEQIKLAYQLAKDQECLGPVLGHFLERVFAIAKKLRTQSDISSGSISTSRAAVELVRERFGTLAEKRVLIIGAGKIGTLAARYFDYYGVRQMTIANRTLAKAATVASLFQAQSTDLSGLPSALRDADVIVSCTSADGLILTRDMLEDAMADAPGTRVLVDLAVPRDIDPDVQQLEQTHLFNVDMLDAVMDANWEKRQAAADEIRERIEDEVQKCLYHLHSRRVGPMIQSLRQQAESIREDALQRGESRFGDLSDEQLQAVDYVTRAIINKLLHAPINYIKQQAASPQHLELIQDAFDLEEGCGS